MPPDCGRVAATLERLDSFWVQQFFLKNRLRIRAGQMAGLDFYGNQEYGATFLLEHQRETTVVWNRKTGKPLSNALVWQDTRVAGDVSELAKTGGQAASERRQACPSRRTLAA